MSWVQAQACLSPCLTTLIHDHEMAHTNPILIFSDDKKIHIEIIRLNYPFTVFKTRSFSERFSLLEDHGASAFINAGAGPPWFKGKYRC